MGVNFPDEPVAPTVKRLTELMALKAGKIATEDKKVLAAESRRRAKRETEIEREGSKITLPADPWMEIPEAIELLQMRHEADQQLYDLHEHIVGYPYDGAAAFYRVLVRKYGFVNAVSVKSWFGERKPQMLNIKVDVNDSIQIPFGAYKLPGFSEPIKTSFCLSHGRPCFSVTAELKAADRHTIKQLLLEAEQELRENSIYRGKALILGTDDDGEEKPTIEPRFMSTANIDPKQLILNDDVEELVDVTLWTPIKHTEECRKEGISLKRINGLYGPYGTGKTLCASVTSKIAVDHGWTFIMVDKAAGLKAALEFAKNFQPSVVFVEDIDRATSERDDHADAIFTAVDGVLSKADEIMVIYTTNHLENIHKAMLRPGRTDALIPIDLPNAEAAEKLVRLYAGKRLANNATLDRLGELIKGTIPSHIAEVVKRARFGMVARGDKKINEDDLLLSARGMQRHVDILSDKPKNPVSDGDVLAMALRRVANGHDNVPEMLKEMHEKIDYMQKRF